MGFWGFGTTPVAWPSTTTVTGPAASKQLIFKLNDDSATFSVTLDSTSYSNIVISSAVDPTPNTETTARSKIPTQIVTGLKVRSPAADSSDSDAIAATTFTSETTEASLNTSKYYVKTLLKDADQAYSDILREEARHVLEYTIPNRLVWQKRPTCRAKKT